MTMSPSYTNSIAIAELIKTMTITPMRIRKPKLKFLNIGHSAIQLYSKKDNRNCKYNDRKHYNQSLQKVVANYNRKRLRVPPSMKIAHPTIKAVKPTKSQNFITTDSLL